MRVSRWGNPPLSHPKITLLEKIALTGSCFWRDKGVNDQDSTEYYATLLALSQDERDELKQLAQNDAFLEQVVQDYAFTWKKCREAQTPARLIRRTFLVRAALVAIKYSFSRECGDNRVEVAFALWFCDQIERLADDLAKADSTANPSGQQEL